MEGVASLEVEGRLYVVYRDGTNLRVVSKDPSRHSRPDNDVMLSLSKREWKNLIKLLGTVV